MRSRRILLYVGILASIWPARKPRLLRHLQDYLNREAHDRLVQIRLKGGHATTPEVSTLPVVFRVGDRADYQTLWECLNEDVYIRPPRPIDFLFDGGGNIGLFTVAVCRSSQIKEAIVVEPDPENLQLLRLNLATLPQAKVIAGALGSNEGDVQFERSGSNVGHVAGAPSSAIATEVITVQCRRLSASIPGTWDMSRMWLKLDVEGAEYAVVPELLRSQLRPAAISLEIHEFDSGGGTSLLRELESAGYEISMLDSGALENTCRQILALRTAAEGS